MNHRTTATTSAVIGHPAALTASPSFYVLMLDYGRAREAVCNPEHTRRDIVSDVRDILAKPNGRRVAFVKFIDGNYCEDITLEILAEAVGDDEATPLSPADLQAARFDHARDLRKELV
jgi:hypothetical protein